MSNLQTVTSKANNSLKRLHVYFIITSLIFFIIACSGGHNKPYTLTIAHLNDTHSHLEPVAVNLTINNLITTAKLGGFARLKTLIDELRSENPKLILLHAGDAVQGTLYFTLFNGTVEFDFMNMLGIDAMTFGNHEFDRGCGIIPDWIARSNFPWLSANINFSGEPAIAPLVAPYIIRKINGERVAIIGMTTEATPQLTKNVGNAVFKSAVESTSKSVEFLSAMGINKIILISHLGYQQDMELAAQITGVDIIVGGHSHSLLGDNKDLSMIGLSAVGPYPTEILAPNGERVLVLQAWQWGHAVGKVIVDFGSTGEIIKHCGRITIPVGETFTQNGKPVPPDSEAYRAILSALAGSSAARIIPENHDVLARLAPYAKQVEEYRSVKIAVAVNDIIRALNSGPGPLACDSMLAAVPNARAAIVNYGGLRRDLLKGDISVGDIMEVMPFGNKLVLVDLSGAELKEALEEGIDFLLKRYPGNNPPVMPYVGGIRFNVSPTKSMGERVSDIEIKTAEGIYQAVLFQQSYRLVVNSFVAEGGDGFVSIKNAKGFRSDTGIIDSDAFRDYIKNLGFVENPTEQRIKIM